MSDTTRYRAPTSAGAEHLPAAAGDPGCLVVLSDRLRKSPGVIAIEATSVTAP